MNWLETNKEPSAYLPIKDLETVKLEYELIEFGSKAIEELVKVVQRTKGVCTKFCRKVLITYNRCQTSVKRRLEEFLDHEGFLKKLQERWKEDEKCTQLVKGLDEKVLKTAIAHATISSHLLEDQLRLILARVANIKSQVAKHEITIIFLEPSRFKTIATYANIWKKIINDMVGPT